MINLKLGVPTGDEGYDAYEAMAQFSFSAVVCNQCKVFTFDAPIDNRGAVITNRFCPKEFLVTPTRVFYVAITPISGESILEFEQDCRNLANAITNSDYQSSNNELDIYIDALACIVAAHNSRCGRLLFGDLLIYIDIFSYFLFADGIDEDIIKTIYSRLVYQFFIGYPNMKDSATLQPLAATNMAAVIRDLNYKAEIKLGIR